jgi:uncharacterized protein GlcG (DUF336 family)
MNPQHSRSSFLIVFLLSALFSYSQVTVTATAGTPGPTSYTTLKAAFAAVNAGTHQGNISITISSATTESGAIQLNASGSGAASYTSVLVKPAASASPVITADSAIKLQGAMNVTIDGSNSSGGTTKDLTINNTSVNGPTIWLENGASSNTIKNCVIKGVANNNGVVYMGTSTAAAGNSNNVIQNNDITKGSVSPLIGIYTAGISGKPNTGNVYRGNRIFDFSLYGFLDGNSSSTGFSDNTLLEGNEIFETVPQTGNLYAIMLDNASGISNMNISKNRIHDLLTSSTGTVAGIDLYDALSVTVSNNMVALNNSTCNVYGIMQETMTGAVIKIYYNSVSIYGTTSGTLSTIAFLKDYTSTGDDVKDNIFSNTKLSSGSGSQYAIAFASTGSMNSDYNDLYSSGNAQNFVGVKSGTNYATLAAWQAGTSLDAHSISIAPVFVSATDLHLVAGSNSGIENKGIPVSVTTDIDNDARSSTPDLGCDEIASACTPPTVTTPNSASICSGVTTNINLTATAPSTYTWTLGTNTGGITGATAGSGPVISQILANPGTTNGSIVYQVTATSGGCSSAPYPITVTVKPVPSVTSGASGTICSGTAQNYQITSNIAGTTFSWNRPAVAGISNAAVSGQTSSVINELLVNTTSSPVTVNYNITPTASGCTGPVFNYTVTVNPTPTVSFTYSSPACSGSAVNFTNTTAGNVSSVNWNFGDGITTTSTASPIQHIYTTAGNYNVTLTVTNNTFCTNSVTQSITISTSTSITTQPVNQTACTGTSVSFSVTASGTNLTYQWRKGGTNIAGATSSTYTITSAGSADAGSYDVVVTGSCGSVTSNTATLTLNTAPSISSQPQNQSACIGSPVSFSVVASGTGLTYTWRKNGVTIPGANASTYTISSVSSGDAGTYDVVVGTSCSTSITSNPATLTIGSGPAITTQPVSQVVCEGAAANFSVTATGSGLTYQWRKGGVAIAGATSSAYTIAATTQADAGSYDVVVGSSCGSTTSSQVSLTVSPATSITSQPVNQTACTGSPVSFSVTASGTNLGYQWRKGGSNIAGATSSTYTIASTTSGDAGSYDVVVTGTCGTVTSNVATLTLNTAPSISSQPQSQSACIGSPVSFSVVASGTGLTYTWRKNGVAIPGANASTYTIASVSSGDVGSYDVIVGTSCSTSITSDPASLTISSGPSITTQPVSQSVCEGAAANFSVTASGSGLTYQWRKSGVAIPGATSSVYTIASTTQADAGSFDVVVGSSCGSNTSSQVSLTVSPATSIITQPVSQTACSGTAVSFSVASSGTGLSYQWRKAGANIAGATSATYTIPSVSAADAGNYDVVVTGSCGTVISNTASLTLNAPPGISSQPQSQSVCQGFSASFTVVASGSGLNYIWRKNGVAIPGANAASYTIGSVTATDAGSYDVVVGTSCNTTTTSSAATLSVNTGAVITSQPAASQTVCEGSSANFSVTATGSGLTYQWRKSGTVITGANSSTYTIASATLSTAGSYDVVISNNCGTIFSNPASLTVNQATSITTQPVNQAACAGSSVSFSVTASNVNVTYQWRKNGVPVAGATASTYMIVSATAADAGSYDVVVSGSCGTVTSNVATLTINTAPSISSQPASVSTCAGNAVTLSVSASGTGLTYQWRKAGTPITGATSSSYIINSVSASDAGSYDVVISSSCGTTVTSNTATITVSSGIQITAQPAPATVCEGSTAHLAVTATGNGPLTYQWRKNTVPIIGATRATYEIVNVAAANQGVYDVVITSACGSLTSQQVILAVNNCTGIPSVNADITSASIMPALAHNFTKVRIVVRREMRTEWVMTDVNGRIILKFTRQLNAGSNELYLELTKIASGTYQVVCNSLTGKHVVLRFIKQ